MTIRPSVYQKLICFYSTTSNDHMVHTCFLIHFFHFFPYTYPVKLASWKLVPSLNATGRCVLFIVKPVGNERGDRHYSMCVEKN